MIKDIQVIHKNGVLHPLQPLNLPEDKIITINLREDLENIETEATNAEKIKAFEEWMANLDPNIPNLTDEQISRESIYEEQIRRQI